MSTHDWAPLWEQLESDRPDDAALLRAATLEVGSPRKLPEEYALFEAPLADYDIVELTVFDRPVARGRVAYGDGFAVVAPVLPVHDDDALGPEHIGAVIERLADNAHAEGAETVYALVPPDAVEHYRAFGFGDAD
ncbi:hypothetical protein [Zhihengliuella halotolerans]|uniref:hypothetical protein n=1 Tax=Zhihengliuella halotolerans TaxID=370736 RepID=UPI000C80070F|nr:hypothetical protein [Zhihengliuella halotolerans]